MRRTIIMTLLLSVGTILTAQDVIYSERSDNKTYFPVPKELTSDKKPYISVFEFKPDSDKSSISIYSSVEPEECLITFDIPNAPSGDSFFEKASGYTEKVVIKDKFYDGMGDDSCYTDSSLQAIEAGIKKAYGYRDGFHITEFTDADGEKGYYGNDYSGYRNDSTRFFYEFEKYGKLYPMEFFVVDTAGKLKHCHFFHYEMEYDFTNATWVRDSDYTSSYISGYNEYRCLLQNVFFQDVDRSFYPNYYIVTSQNIFNADASWEYILADVDYYLEYGEPQKMGEDGMMRRIVYQTPVYKGYIVMNSAGERLYYIPVSDKKGEFTVSAEIRLVSVVNGNIYIDAHERVRYGSPDSYNYGVFESLYVIESSTTEVQSVCLNTAGKMAVGSVGPNQEDLLSICVSEQLEGDNIYISNMSGQVITHFAVEGSGHILINTGSYPKGLYNVTLQSKSGIENKRILLK